MKNNRRDTSWKFTLLVYNPARQSSQITRRRTLPEGNGILTETKRDASDSSVPLRFVNSIYRRPEVARGGEEAFPPPCDSERAGDIDMPPPDSRGLNEELGALIERGAENSEEE